MSILRFQNLLDSQYAYTAHSNSMDIDNYERRNIVRVADFAGLYPTFGDGLTQHGHESAVPREQFSAYLGSLAAHLIEHPADVEVFTENYMWPSRLSNEAMAFAFGVKYRDPEKIGKYVREYYSLQQRKKSTNSEKQHDDRWTQVASWMNGSVESAYRILLPSYRSDLLHAYAIYQQVRDFAYATGRGETGESPEQFLKLESPGEFSPAGQAFDTVRLILEAAKTAKTAKRQFECWVHNAGVKLVPAEIEAA